MKLIYNSAWIRDAGNPVLPPRPDNAFDSNCCMNPWVVKREDRYELYYAGADRNGNRRICLATASEADIRNWERHGVVLDIGAPGSIDANWCVLPHMIDTDDTTRFLYYTANSGVGAGLSAFPGIGVAISKNNGPWEKYSGSPVLRRTLQTGDPDCQGIAGGSVMRVVDEAGRTLWRFYYTGCPTLGDDVFLDQQKQICLAVSEDGLHWEKQGAVLKRDPRHDYENIAVAGPVVRRLPSGMYQLWYSAIGTRWGYYSICYAESMDGVHWNRGTDYGDNLQLGPRGSGWAANDWENKMVEYPSVVTLDSGAYRLFYTGNGYGEGGIGTALSAPLRVTRDGQAAHLVAGGGQGAWRMEFGSIQTQSSEEWTVQWLGPDADGTIWFEAQVIPELHCRVRLVHVEEGLSCKITLMNESSSEIPAGVTWLIRLQSVGNKLDDHGGALVEDYARSSKANLSLAMKYSEDSKLICSDVDGVSVAEVVFENIGAGSTVTGEILIRLECE